MREEVWEKLAKSKGYASLKELLEFFYLKEIKPVSFIAGELGCSEATVYNMLDLYGIPKRIKTAMDVHIKKKELLNTPIRDLATKYKVSASYVWRLRNKVRGTTP